MKLKFRITSLSRESGQVTPQNPVPISAVKVVATFRGPNFTDPRVPMGQQPVAGWNAQNQAALITFFVSEAEGSALHIDQEFDAEIHGERHPHQAA